VDVFYDDRVKMVISAEAPPDALFPEGENAAEFQRTVSRLHEMQSERYLQSERRRSSGETAGKIQGVQAHRGG